MNRDTLNVRNFLELKGHLVYLKKLDQENLEEYWQALSNSSMESTLFTGTQQVFNKTDVEGYIAAIAADRSRVDLLIYEKESAKLLGEVVLSDISRNNRNASLRIAINHKDDFGQGYGSEALILALHYGFGMLNLHRIELEVLAFNERAIYVYEKIGFQREGIRRDGCFFNHRYHDAITMSMLEEEFRAQYLSGEDESKMVR